MKGGRFLGVAGGNWGRPGAPLKHRQPPATDTPSPNSTDPKISTFFNVTFISSRSSTVRTLDRWTSWAPCRNSIKAFAPYILQGASITLHTILLGVGGTIYNYNRTLKPFKELGLDFLRVKKLASKLHFHFVNYAAKLVHTRRALSSTIINCHQEPLSIQACNPPAWSPLILFLFVLVEESYGTLFQVAPYL